MKKTFEQLKENINNKVTSSKEFVSNKFAACSEFLSDKNNLIDVSKKAACSALAVLTLLSGGEAIKTYVQHKNQIENPTSISANNPDVNLGGNLDSQSTVQLPEIDLTTTTKFPTTTQPFSTTTTTQPSVKPESETVTQNDEKPVQKPDQILESELDTSIKFMSFNIEMHYSPTVKNNPLYSWDSRKEYVVQEVENLNPDIICFQEITPTMNTYLKENLDGYAVSYFYRRNSDKSSFSTAFYYKEDRFEEIDDGKFWLSETPNVESVGWDGDIRTCAWEIFKDKHTDKEFCVMNTHYTLRSRTAMNNSSLLINEKTKEIGLPTIIMGDFNSNEDYACYKTTTEVFDDVHKIAENVIDEGCSFNGYDLETHGHKKEIDFFFVTKGDWKVNSYELLDDQYEEYIEEYGKPFNEQANRPSSPSDHFAIATEVELND